MKEAIVHPGLTVKIIDSPIPTPGPDDVVIKVAVSGSNPKDWKSVDLRNNPHNSGDDIAGTIHSLGTNCPPEFHLGDRVAAFHRMFKPHGSFAEYAVAPAYTTFHIPTRTSFEEAATIPLAAMTAACGLFLKLGLPEPWTGGRADGKVKDNAGKEKEKEKGRRGTTPLVIYGAASAVGAYAIQLAKRAGIGPLICVAGKGCGFVEGMLDKDAGDVVVDYRKGDEAVVDGIRMGLYGMMGKVEKLWYAFDAVSDKGSFLNICKVLEKDGGKITLVRPGEEYKGIPETVVKSVTTVSSVHGDQTDFGAAWYRLFAKGLGEGWFRGHPTEVVPGGLRGVETGLRNLKEGKASAVKYVFRIAETEGVPPTNEHKL